jgi:hypothetical protein
MYRVSQKVWPSSVCIGSYFKLCELREIFELLDKPAAIPLHCLLQQFYIAIEIVDLSFWSDAA